MVSGATILSVLVVAMLLFIDASAAARIDLYQHAGHTGELLASTTTSGHTCYNMAASKNDRASSVNTHGSCFILFTDAYCQGESLRVAPGVGCHSNLADCNFNDITSSYKIC